jgi:hypothetical protein
METEDREDAKIISMQVHFRGGRSSIDLTAYPDLNIFFEDLAAVYRAKILISAR